MIACIAANPSIDRLLRVERLAPGEIHRPIEAIAVPGGKGLNVARAAAMLGADVRAVALLAGHAGRFIEDGLRAAGVSLASCWAEGETRTSVSVSSEASNGLTEFYERGVAVSAEAWSAFAAAAAEAAAAASWTTISGSLPPGAPPDGYAPIVARGRVALDTRERGLEAEPALVKVNAAEAEELTGLTGIAAAEALHRLGAGTAIVTLGRDGAIAVTHEGRLRVRTEASGRYPVGSGDAFLAGLVTALDRGDDLERALALAAGAGAANAEEAGAGVLRRARAEELAAVARVERL